MSTTFPAVLAAQLRKNAGRPLVTFYDDATGERVELSVATYENWVAKTANLLQDEGGLEGGDVVLLDLPTHWLGAVWLGAAWSLGLAVRVGPGAAPAALTVCGPAGVETYAAGGGPVIAMSLAPLAAPFTEALPAGVNDFAAEVLAQPDQLVANDPPDAASPAWEDSSGGLTQSALISDAGDLAVDRLLTDLNPCSRAGVRALLGPLQAGGGTVWVVNADPAGWEHRRTSERATAVLRAAEAQPARS